MLREKTSIFWMSLQSTAPEVTKGIWKGDVGYKLRNREELPLAPPLQAFAGLSPSRQELLPALQEPAPFPLRFLQPPFSLTPPLKHLLLQQCSLQDGLPVVSALCPLQQRDQTQNGRRRFFAASSSSQRREAQTQQSCKDTWHSALASDYPQCSPR